MSDDKKFQQIYAEGSYELEALDNTWAESGAGNPYLAVKVKVVKMEKTKNGSPIPTQIMDGHRYINLSFTEGTIERSRAFLKEAGYRGSDLRELDAKHQNHKSLAGYRFKAGCKHEPDFKDKSKTRDKFEAYSNNGGNTKWMDNLKSVSQTRLLGLNALWNSQNSGVSATQHVQQASSEAAPFAPDNAETATDASFNWD